MVSKIEMTVAVQCEMEARWGSKSVVMNDDPLVKMAALKQAIRTQQTGYRIAFSLLERPNIRRLRNCTGTLVFG